MKTNRSHKLVRYLIFTCLAVCFSAALLSAEDWRATFSLPFETQWGETVLPAGDYCLRFNDWGYKPMFLESDTQFIGYLRVLSEEFTWRLGAGGTLGLGPIKGDVKRHISPPGSVPGRFRLDIQPSLPGRAPSRRE